MPQKAGVPPGASGSVPSLFVVAVLLGAAYLLLVHAFGLPFPVEKSLVRVGVLLGLRTLGDNYMGLFKRVRSAEFAGLDTKIYTPLAASIAAAAGLTGLLGS